MNRVWAILYKEWLELRKERMLVLGTLLPAFFLTVIPLVVFYFTGSESIPDEELNDLGAIAANPLLEGMSAQELIQSLLGQQFSTLMLLLPLIVPSIISAHSIVGEKTRRTLEPMLATPLRTSELLFAKSLAAFLPALLVTLVCGGAFAAGVSSFAVSERVFGAVINPAWLLLLLLCSPLMSLLSIAIAMIISSRVRDPRTAQQLSALIALPVMLVFFGQLVGVVVLRPVLVLAAAAVIAFLATLAFWVATRIFQRESILTRWG